MNANALPNGETAKKLEESLSKLIELLNSMEDTNQRAAALLIAVSRLIDGSELPLMAKAGILRMLETAFDESIRFLIQASSSSQLIL
jgi:hypothetical protein